LTREKILRKIPPLLLLAFAAVMAVTAAAHAQRNCKDGARAALAGTIQKIDRAEPEPGARIWMITPHGTPTGACVVKQLWGRDQPPANCTQGKSFSASGKVVDAESLVLLNVDSVTCE
jgi:hypothetical protein